MNATFQRWSLAASAATVTALVHTSTAFAQFGGPAPDLPGTASGASEQEIRDTITDILNAILNFLALIAVVVVVIAGVRLIVSQGDEDAKEKAKKTIFYALIGLVIILFARVIVGLVTNYLASRVS
jgi:amino acid transporter